MARDNAWGALQDCKGSPKIPYDALRLSLASRRHRIALGCCATPLSQKSNKKLQKHQSTNERGRVGATIGREGRKIDIKK